MRVVIDFDDALPERTKRQIQARTDSQLFSARSQTFCDGFKLDDGRSLEQVVDLITHSPWVELQNEFSATVQEQIGRKLWQCLGIATAGDTGDEHPLEARLNQPADLLIAANHSVLDRTPWVLLCQHGTFLVDRGWSVSLLHPESDLSDAEHPIEPIQMLLVMPDPDSNTEAGSHLAELQSHVGSRVASATWQPVRTFAELAERLKPSGRSVDCLYYYGHGHTDRHQADLVFEDNGAPHYKSINSLAALLRGLPFPPRIVYVNCCRGNAAFNLGVGKQLGGLAPFVLANRTVATVDAARKQGVAFWSRVIQQRKPPHEAAAELYRGRNSWGLDIDDPRWMTPVNYRGYSLWQPPNRQWELDPDWRQKLDRIEQTGTARYLVDDMLKSGQPRGICVCWYGEDGHGVETFRERLQTELDDVSDARCLIVQPEWPPVPRRSSFCDMLQSALEITNIADLPAVLRRHQQGGHDRRHALLVLHNPVRSRKELSPEQLLEYLRWWDDAILPLLEPRQNVVIALGFAVTNAVNFHHLIEDRARIPAEPFAHLVFRFLSVLHELGSNDIRDFFKRINISRILSPAEQEHVIQSIVHRTEGQYDRVVSELEMALKKGFHELLSSRVCDEPSALTEDEY